MGENSPETFDHEAVAVGDNHGNLDALSFCLKRSGIIDNQENPLTPTRHVIFLGDNLGDRNTQSIPSAMLQWKIREKYLSSVKRFTFGMIDGNHDYLAIAYLLGLPSADGLDPLEICLTRGASGRYPGLGIIEFAKFIPHFDLFVDPEILYNESVDEEVVDQYRSLLRQEQPRMLGYLQHSTVGQRIMENLRESRLYVQLGNTLFFHTPPSCDMIQMLLDQKDLNLRYTAAKAGLFSGTQNAVDQKSVRESVQVFLHPKNRLRFQEYKDLLHSDSEHAKRLRFELKNSLGIGRVVFGHETIDPYTFSVDGIGFYGIDRGSGKDRLRVSPSFPDPSFMIITGIRAGIKEIL